jgi:putative peptide zinc metalloprotease protein
VPPAGRGRRAQQRRADDLRRDVGTPFEGSRRIVVLSRKGGVGKTTTTLMLGHTLAVHRGDRVVALDANPDAGSLGMRVARQSALSATDLLAERAWVQRYSQLRSFTSQDPRTRLEVIASDDDPRITSALNREDYRHLIDVLDRYFTLVVVDTGTGVLDDGIQGVLDEADQLVVVVPPALDGARVSAMTLDWLEEHGHQALAANAVAVVNAVRMPGSAQLDRIEDHFRGRCTSVHRIPWDPRLATSAHASLADLRPATQQAYLELAAAVGHGFASSPRTTPVVGS